MDISQLLDDADNTDNTDNTSQRPRTPPSSSRTWSPCPRSPSTASPPAVNLFSGVVSPNDLPGGLDRALRDLCLFAAPFTSAAAAHVARLPLDILETYAATLEHRHLLHRGGGLWTVHPAVRAKALGLVDGAQVPGDTAFDGHSSSSDEESSPWDDSRRPARPSRVAEQALAMAQRNASARAMVDFFIERLRLANRIATLDNPQAYDQAYVIWNQDKQHIEYCMQIATDDEIERFCVAGAYFLRYSLPTSKLIALHERVSVARQADTAPLISSDEALLCFSLARAYANGRRLEEATKLLNRVESYYVAHRLQFSLDAAKVHQNFARIAEFQGEFDVAVERHMHSLHLRSATGQRQQIGFAFALGDFGRVLCKMGQFREAETVYDMQLRLLEDLGFTRALEGASSLSILGSLYLRSGHLAESLAAYLKAADKLARTDLNAMTDPRPLNREVFMGLAKTYEKLQLWSDAETAYAEVYRSCRADGLEDDARVAADAQSRCAAKAVPPMPVPEMSEPSAMSFK